MFTIVLLRHGESTLNRENRFTGWTDVDLSEKGRGEARRSARLLADTGLSFDVCYTSMLRRAIRTLWIVLDDMDLMYLPVHHSWRLNERHYGALQGLDKREMTEKYGKEQVLLWRRGYSVRPPALADDDPRHPRFDPRYTGMGPEALPATESLEDTLARVVPYLERNDRTGGAGEETDPRRSPRQQHPCLGQSPSIMCLTTRSPGSTSRPVSRWSTNWTMPCARFATPISATPMRSGARLNR